MLEFVFFNREPFQRFLDLAHSAGVKTSVNSDDETLVVLLDEDIDDDILDAMEAHYDSLLDLDQSLVEMALGDDDSELLSAGITIELKDGRTVYARVAPKLLSRVLQCINNDELNSIVTAITDAVENPDPRRLCQR
ncbi:MAG: hypothetical protein WBN96_05840 [Gammaproteobacteria bacterium]